MATISDLQSRDIDLEVLVNKAEGDPTDTYWVAVTHAPVPGLGGLHCFDASPLIQRARQLERQVEEAIGQGHDLANVRSPLYREFMALGRAIFNAVLPEGSSARRCFTLSLGLVSSGKLGTAKRLRLRLNIHQALHHLPWEILRYSGDDIDGRYTEFFLATDPRTALIRYMGNTVWRDESLFTKSYLQLGVAIVVANPYCIDGSTDYEEALSRSIEAEKQAVKEAIQPLVASGQVRDIWLEGHATLQQMLSKIDDGVHIVHYIGEGDFGEELGSFVIGVDEQGRACEIGGEQLARALAQSRSLRLVVLNACRGGMARQDTSFGSVAFRLAQDLGVPAVIAMKYLVRSETAARLAKELYNRLVNVPSTIHEALKYACSFIEATPNRIEWATPLLIMSSVNGVFLDIPLAMPPRHQALETPGPVLPPAFLQEATPEPEVQEAVPEPPPASSEEPGEMVLIPQGEFEKGLTKEQADALVERIFRRAYNIEDTPASRDNLRAILLKEEHQTGYLPSFYMDMYPVTNEQFEVFVKATGYITDAERRRETATWHTYYDGPEKGRHPVVAVSWNDASTYAHWAGKRLPTAEEWEKAARGQHGNLYPWGNQWDAHRCNNAASMSEFTTTPVDWHKEGRSPYGAYDMVGNVGEWTSTDIRGYKLVLGGAWNDPCEIYGLVALARQVIPSLATSQIGFRCARDDSLEAH